MHKLHNFLFFLFISRSIMVSSNVLLLFTNSCLIYPIDLIIKLFLLSSQMIVCLFNPLLFFLYNFFHFFYFIEGFVLLNECLFYVLILILTFQPGQIGQTQFFTRSLNHASEINQPLFFNCFHFLLQLQHFVFVFFILSFLGA